MDSDPVFTASKSITSLSATARAPESVLRLIVGGDEEREIVLDVQISHHKFQLWQQNWSGQTQRSNVTAEALWGVQGWDIIRGMLGKITEASRQIEEFLSEAKAPQSAKPRSRWKTTVKALRTKKRSTKNFEELRKLAVILTRSVDQLWIYSETVFDTLHGILAQEIRLPERERLLRLALQSRAGSLALYTWCSNSTEDCSLEINLFDAGMALSKMSNEQESLFYHLFTPAREAPQEIQKLIVEVVPEVDISTPVKSKLIEPNQSDPQLWKLRSGPGTRMIRVSPHGSSPPSCLLIPPNPIKTILLDSRPKSLADVLTKLEKATNSSTEEHFSTGAKVELAYKVIECGLFLIGTPWFSSLTSQNILRLKSAGKERPSFILEVQTVDTNDLLFDDPGALAETSQLFRIGILLMEIALDKPDGSSRTEDYGHDAERISKLPLIEQSMGTQYCKATAFCLQHRPPKSRFRGPEKYEDENFDDWESYLADFLLEYHSQVFLRLQELREVDTEEEYQSVKFSEREDS